MGRKPVRTRKHIYVLLAGLILALLWGCASFERGRLSKEVKNADELYARGDFEGALKVNNNIASLSEGKPPGDQAFFNMGLIYADSKYTRKDYRKSAAFFQRVIREYPQSSLVAQAKAWVGVLEVIEKSKEVDLELERTKKRRIR